MPDKIINDQVIDNSDAEGNRCGFVAVIGAPNAGKSTLINHCVGGKVSIVSPKVQTTRTIVRGIVIEGQSQIVFIDTPGIFSPSKGQRLERAIVAAAWDGQADADIIVLMVDVSRYPKIGETKSIIKKLKQQSEAGGAANYILVLNKIDQIARDKLLMISAKLNEELDFTATFMISALNGSGIKGFMEYIAKQVQLGRWMYPEDQISDMPMRLLAAEITREKLFHRLHDELPYGLTVETEKWEVFDNGSIKIDQIIYISRENHKGMLLGKDGKKLTANELRDFLNDKISKIEMPRKFEFRDEPLPKTMIGKLSRKDVLEEEDVLEAEKRNHADKKPENQT